MNKRHLKEEEEMDGKRVWREKRKLGERKEGIREGGKKVLGFVRGRCKRPKSKGKPGDV